MPTQDDVKALGEEIERLREARSAEFPTLRALATAAGVSYTRLVEIRQGYKSKIRNVTVPSDHILNQLAKTLNTPVSRFHAKLGRLPDEPYDGLNDPDVLDMAEAYRRLPDYGRKMLRTMLKIVEETVELVETAKEEPSGSTNSN